MTDIDLLVKYLPQKALADILHHAFNEVDNLAEDASNWKREYEKVQESWQMEVRDLQSQRAALEKVNLSLGAELHKAHTVALAPQTEAGRAVIDAAVAWTDRGGGWEKTEELLDAVRAWKEERGGS
jgi:hypothetical protein